MSKTETIIAIVALLLFAPIGAAFNDFLRHGGRRRK